MTAARGPGGRAAATMRRSGSLAPSSTAPFLVAAVSAAMCFLAVLALEAAVGAARVSGAWTAGLQGSATIRVPAPSGWDAAAPAATAAMAAATTAPGVRALRLLDRAEIEALIGPWLGTGGQRLVGAEAAAPLLIDVTLDDPPPDPAALQALLDIAAPGAVYDDHAAWRAPLQDAAAAFRRLTFWSVALMAAALAAMVVTAARASVAGAVATVRTLRLVGARDAFIARAFDLPIAGRALVGGALGALAAAGALVAAPPLGLAEGLGAAQQAYRPGLAPLIAAPVASAALAFVTARLTVMAMLRREA